MTVSWLTAVIDLSEPDYELGCAFWQGVTGYGLSAARGASGGCALLLPPDGDPYLGVQRIGAGPAGCHLDVHVDDATRVADLAVRAGARVLDESGGALVLASTGGIAFCLVDGADLRSVRPLPTRWASGQRSLVDQLCIDVPHPRYDEECSFWAQLTGWQIHAGARPEFRYLARPKGMPLRLLLQRREEGADACLAHLDLACDDLNAETERHKALGALGVRVMPDWVTLRAPAGQEYCITRRNPQTGRLE